MPDSAEKKYFLPRKSNHRRCSVKKAVLKNFEIFTGKHFVCFVLCLFLIKLQGLQSCNFINKKLQHMCFPVNIAKFLRTSILKKNFRLLLKISTSVTNLPRGGNSWIFYPFKPFSILDFAMTEWFCWVTSFAKVFLLFFSLKQFYDTVIRNKLFGNVVHTSSEMLPFLHLWDYCWNCEFDTDVKIE